MVRRSVGARVAGLQQRGGRFAGPGLPVIDEREERGVSVGLLPGRGGVLLLGAREHQDAVDAHGHPRVGGRPGRPDAFADLRGAARIADSAFRLADARASTSQETVGSDATGPNRPGSARSTPTSARRPRRARATPRSTLPGS